MHCEACKQLVRLELEENGFGHAIATLAVDEARQLGILSLRDTTNDDILSIKEIINSMDAYTVV